MILKRSKSVVLARAALGGALLGPAGRLPLGVHVLSLEDALEVAVAHATGRRDDDIREREGLEVDGLALNTGHGKRAVNQGAVVVNHIEDNAELALVVTGVNKGHTANLDVTLERHGETVKLIS